MRTLKVRPVSMLVLAVLLAAPVVADEVWFAGVASLSGANGTQWRSEVVLHNATGIAQEIRLDLLARGSESVAASQTLTLAAGEVRGLPDLYAALGAAPGSGVLRVEGTAMTWVRTFNQGEHGTFGQDVPAARLSSSVPPGEKRLFPATTSRDLGTGFRSNLLLLNLGTEVGAFTVRGCGASTSIEIPGGAYDQLNNLGGWLGCPDGKLVAEVEGNGPWHGYVSTVDPTTGDPTTVSGMLAPTGAEVANHAPVIALFTASPAEVVAGQETELRGAFYDPDQEQVTWSLRILPGSTANAAVVGPATGTGSLISRVRVRKAGLMLVEVTVIDGHGGVSKAVAGASVLCCGT